MKNATKTLFLSTALAILALPVVAQSNTPAPVTGESIQDRKENQQDRIANGVKSGELTAGETTNLDKKESNLNQEERDMRKLDNGKLTKADKTTLNQQQNHVYTLRPDFPEIPGVVVREDPHAALEKKLEYLRWLREQIDAGKREGLTPTAVEATCFPWGRGRGWESFSKNELIRVLSLGHFSRSELVRSFVRAGAAGKVVPMVYQARLHGGDPAKPAPKA